MCNVMYISLNVFRLYVPTIHNYIRTDVNKTLLLQKYSLESPDTHTTHIHAHERGHEHTRTRIRKIMYIHIHIYKYGFKKSLLYVQFAYVTAFNPCNPNPCSNGGTCTKKGQGYQCSCSSNYEGKTCKSEFFTF